MQTRAREISPLGVTCKPPRKKSSDAQFRVAAGGDLYGGGDRFSLARHQTASNQMIREVENAPGARAPIGRMSAVNETHELKGSSTPGLLIVWRELRETKKP